MKLEWESDPVVGGPTPATAGGGGWQSDPVVGGAAPEQHGALYNTFLKEGSGGSALGSADEGILPAARDYGLAGLDDLTLGYGVPNALKEATARAQSNLGPP